MIALLLILIPIATILLIALVQQRTFDRGVALISSLATFILATFVAESSFIRLWLNSFLDLDFKVYFALDGGGGSSLLTLTANLVMTLAIMYAGFKIKNYTGAFLSMLLLMQAGLNGIFLARDLVLFYIFWEITFIPSLVMLFVWGNEQRKEATYSYLIYALSGSLVMLVVILAIKPLTGAASYLFSDLLAVTPNLPQNTQIWLFVGFAIAFAVKTPILPVHSWLINFHEQNHSCGAADVAGTLYKVGAWGFFAWALPLFPKAAETLAPYLLTLAVITALYAAWLATYQTHLKRLLAYASLSHMGIIAAGIFALHITGLNGAIYLLAAQMVSTSGLFLIAGMLFERQKSFELDNYGGVAKNAPRLAGVTLFILLTSIGLPGLANFPGEFLSLLGVFQQNPYLAIIACGAIIAAGVYGVNLYQRIFQGEEKVKLTELGVGESTILAPLVLMIIYLGVLPHRHLQNIEVQAKIVANEHINLFNAEYLSEKSSKNIQESTKPKQNKGEH